MVDTPLIPTLRKQRQADVCEFKASQVYIGSSRLGLQGDTISKINK